MADDPDNNFVDPFLLILTLVLTLVLIFGNIYFVAHYSHHADSFFGSSTACKAVLVVGYALAQCQVLMLPLDVQNTREGTDFLMYMMWYIVVMAALFYITVALPFGLFYSETDEEKEFKWRICSAFKNEVILLVILSVIVFPMYSFMNYSYFPITLRSCDAETQFMNANVVIDPDYTSPCKMAETEVEVRVGFQIFALSLMVFVGWLLLCIFLPTGMQAIPFDLGAQWVTRPRPLDQQKFNSAKAELAKKVSQMLQMGKTLISQKKSLADTTRNMWMFGRWRAKSTLKGEQHQFEINCILAEREFQKLDNIASYNKKVEPMKYGCKLILAVLSFTLSVFVVIHVFCYSVLKVDGKEVEPFLNDMIEQIEGTPMGFLASVVLILLGMFMVLAALNGHIKLGLRFFFISFYPVVPKETFVNAFMANCMVMNLWMTSLIQLMNVLFRGYLRGTQTAKIFQVQIRNMYFFSFFYQYNFFIIWMLIWWFIALIYLVLKPIEKINLGPDVKRADLSAKQ